MGKLIPLTRLRSAQQVSSAGSLGARDVAYTEHELWPIAALLFVFSVARVAHALVRHEPFDTEPTLALVCLVGLPILGWKRRRKRS